MTYTSSKLDEFKAGDIICYRSAESNTSTMAQDIATLQSTLKGFDSGHKTTIHMMIVTEIIDNIPMIAHIDVPDEKDIQHKSYKGKSSYGVPKIEEFTKYYKDSNLMIIRNKDIELRSLIASSAKEVVETQREQGVSFQFNGALSTYLKTLFSRSTDSKQIERTINKSICSQFITEVTRKAAGKVNLNSSDLLDVDTSVAMPKVIEHAFKTKHDKDYEFLIKPLKSEKSFTLDIFETIKVISPISCERLTVLYESLDDNLAITNNDFDSGRVLLFFAKEILSPKEYKIIDRKMKKEWGIFNEDVSHIQLREAKTLINQAIKDVSEDLSITTVLSAPIKKWKLSQETIDKPIKKVLIKKSNVVFNKEFSTFDSSMIKIKLLLKIKKIRLKSKKTDIKLIALNDFLKTFEDLKININNSDDKKIEEIFNKIESIQKYINRLPEEGNTKKTLNEALTHIKSIKIEFEKSTQASLSIVR